MVNAGYIISNVLAFVFSGIVFYQAYRNPKKIRYFVAVYAFLTLPASIVNTLTAEGLIQDRWNTLCYLLVTMIMVAMNHYITLDIGYKMQVRASWLNYLALGSWATVIAVIAILIVQIVFLLVQQDREFTIRWMFIFGVCMAIVGASCAFFFSFWPLIRWRKNRTQEAHSRTTAYGIWYLSIDGIWYSLYGILYVWFFIVNTWDQFNNMLAADYTMRFVLCLMFTWPPPKWIIDCVSSQLSSQGNNLQTVPGTLSQNIPDTYMPSMLSEDRFVYDEEHKMGSRIAMVTTQKPEPTYANPTYANPTYANPAFANSTYPDKPI